MKHNVFLNIIDATWRFASWQIQDLFVWRKILFFNVLLQNNIFKWIQEVLAVNLIITHYQAVI